MKIKWIAVFILLSVARVTWAASGVPAGKYEIDAAHSKVGFEIAHLVISSVEGRFEKFSGNISVGEKPEASQVTVQIETGSIDTGMERRNNHLRSPDFFDAAKYPIMTFKSKKISMDDSAFKITGDLTMHGVTKEVTLDGKYLGAVKDQSGNEKIAAQAGTKINRKDFGLTWNKLIEAGAIVGDEVTVSLKIEAARQPGGEK